MYLKVIKLIDMLYVFIKAIPLNNKLFPVLFGMTVIAKLSKTRLISIWAKSLNDLQLLLWYFWHSNHTPSSTITRKFKRFKPNIRILTFSSYVRIHSNQLSGIYRLYDKSYIKLIETQTIHIDQPIRVLLFDHTAWYVSSISIVFPS